MTTNTPAVAGRGTMRSTQAAMASITDVAQSLRVDWNRGLSSAEAEQRRQLHGFNEFNIKEEEPLWKRYLKQVRMKASWFTGDQIQWASINMIILPLFLVQRPSYSVAAGISIYQCLHQTV